MKAASAASAASTTLQQLPVKAASAASAASTSLQQLPVKAASAASMHQTSFVEKSMEMEEDTHAYNSNTHRTVVDCSYGSKDSFAGFAPVVTLVGDRSTSTVSVRRSRRNATGSSFDHIRLFRRFLFQVQDTPSDNDLAFWQRWQSPFSFLAGALTFWKVLYAGERSLDKRLGERG